MSPGVQSASYEMASVLFMDIVSYSLRSIDEQTELLTMLQEAVRETGEFKAASAKNELLSLPTGDGMALVFLHDPVSPAKCALEIAALLKDHAQIKLRMGLHIGPVRRHADIRENMNVVGGGINMAQRVMDCGDTGHILVSQQVAEVLQQLRGWGDSLHDLGIQEVKHGVTVHLYNLYKNGLGNQDLPKKLQGVAIKPPAPIAPVSSNRRKWGIVAGAVVVIAAVAMLALFDWKKPAATAQPVAAGPAPETEIAYSVTVQKYRNGKPYEAPFRLSGERIFERDYRIQFHISTPKPGYLYVLNEGAESTDEKPDLNMLFPTPARSKGSALLDPEQEIEIPEAGYFKFDNQKGTEKVWMVSSVSAVPELEGLKKWVNEQNIGHVGDAVQALAVLTLLRKLTTASVEITRNKTVLKGKGNPLAHQLQLEHY